MLWLDFTVIHYGGYVAATAIPNSKIPGVPGVYYLGAACCLILNSGFLSGLRTRLRGGAAAFFRQHTPVCFFRRLSDQKHGALQRRPLCFWSDTP
jgi:hypothetical protein